MGQISVGANRLEARNGSVLSEEDKRRAADLRPLVPETGLCEVPLKGADAGRVVHHEARRDFVVVAGQPFVLGLDRRPVSDGHPTSTPPARVYPTTIDEPAIKFFVVKSLD